MRLIRKYKSFAFTDNLRKYTKYKISIEVSVEEFSIKSTYFQLRSIVQELENASFTRVGSVRIFNKFMLLDRLFRLLFRFLF